MRLLTLALLVGLALLAGCKNEEPVNAGTDEANMSNVEAEGAAGGPLPEEED